MVSKHNCLQEEPELLRRWLILDLNPREFWKIWKYQQQRGYQDHRVWDSSGGQWFDPTGSLAKTSKQANRYTRGASLLAQWAGIHLPTQGPGFNP